MLDKRPGLATLVFVSDHGTAIYEDGKSLYLGMLQQNFMIPFVVWMNEASRDQFSDEFSYLRCNRDRKLDARFVFQTVLDAAAIQIDDPNPDLSLARRCVDDVANRMVWDGQAMRLFEEVPNN